MASKLANIHSKLKIEYGSFSEEYPEQLMSSIFLPGNAKVLEIGGCIGRNSLVIASILDDQRNLVVLESSADNIPKLVHNRSLNNYTFHIEGSALSERRIIQRGWRSVATDDNIDGYSEVQTITFDQLQAKYNIEFDTIVADCEGSMYYILKDNPDILNNIRLFVVENDYIEAGNREYVNELLQKLGFRNVYNDAHPYPHVSDPSFFQVWSR
jgi:FkbM family methyltransferase